MKITHYINDFSFSQLLIKLNLLPLHTKYAI